MPMNEYGSTGGFAVSVNAAAVNAGAKRWWRLYL